MPKVIIHYFSATGNTKRAVDILAETLGKRNIYRIHIVYSAG